MAKGRNLFSDNPDASVQPSIRKGRNLFTTGLTGEPPVVVPRGGGGAGVGVETFGQFVQNIPKSASQNAQNLVNVIKHPIETSKSLFTLAKGIVSTVIPGEQPSEQAVVALSDFIKERYGSVENAKQTFLNDPAGVALDLSAVLGVGGGLLQAGGKTATVSGLTRTGQTLSKAGKITSRVGAEVTGIPTAVRTGTGAIAKAGAPFRSSVNVPVQQASQRLGVELPAAALSENRVVQLAESAAAKGVFGGKAIQRLDNAMAKLTGIADDVVARADKAGNPSLAGRIIGENFNRIRTKWFDLKNSLYEKAGLPKSGKKVVTKPKVKDSVITDASGNKLKIVETENVIQDVINLEVNASASSKFATTMLNELKSGSRAGPVQGKAFWNEVATKLSKPLEARDLKNFIQQVNRRIKNRTDPVATGFEAELKKLAVLASDDLDTAVVSANPGLARNIDRANKVMSEGVQKLNSKIGKDITRAVKLEQYDSIPKMVENAIKVSIDDIPRVKEIVGPKNWTLVQGSMMRDLFKNSINPSTLVFKPQSLARQVQKIGRDRLQLVLSPNQMQMVDDLTKVTGALGKPISIIGGSQTGFINVIKNLGFTIVASPFKGLSLLFGESVFNKFIGSKNGQKFLTTGFDIIRKPAEAVGRQAPAIGTGSAILRELGRPAELER